MRRQERVPERQDHRKIHQAEVARGVRHHRADPDNSQDAAGNPEGKVQAVGFHEGVDEQDLERQVEQAEEHGEAERLQVAHQLQTLDDMPCDGGPPAFVKHWVRMVLTRNDPEQAGCGEDHEAAQDLNEEREIVGQPLDETGGDQESDEYPNAIDDALDRGGCQPQREA